MACVPLCFALLTVNTSPSSCQAPREAYLKQLCWDRLARIWEEASHCWPRRKFTQTELHEALSSCCFGGKKTKQTNKQKTLSLGSLQLREKAKKKKKTMKDLGSRQSFIVLQYDK